MPALYVSIKVVKNNKTEHLDKLTQPKVQILSSQGLKQFMIQKFLLLLVTLKGAKHDQSKALKPNFDSAY